MTINRVEVRLARVYLPIPLIVRIETVIQVDQYKVSTSVRDR